MRLTKVEKRLLLNLVYSRIVRCDDTLNDRAASAAEQRGAAQEKSSLNTLAAKLKAGLMR